MIDVDYVNRCLPPEHNCHWVESVPSTQAAVQPNSLLIAEHQSAGVGRHGKQWLSPKGRSVCMSYRFDLPVNINQMSGYALVVAWTLLATLNKFQGTAQTKLKWPNDLYHDDKKFAGILISLTPRPANNNGVEVIVGVGINWQLTDAQLSAVNQAVTNIPIEPLPTRSEFIAQFAQQLNEHNAKFIQLGLAHLLRQWPQHDYLTDKQIMITHGSSSTTGLYHGLNQAGELLVKTASGIKTFCSGEVSVKAV